MEAGEKGKILGGKLPTKGNGLSLSIAGKQLSDVACSLCFLLAHCEVKWVPAFLLLRPFLHQRRWQFDGEVLSAASKGRKYLPHWPLQLFEQTYFGWNHESVFPYSELNLIKSLALFEKPLTGEHPSIIEELRLLVSSGTFRITAQNCTVGFTMSEVFKEYLRSSCSKTETIGTLSDLVLLLIEAMPDPYAESLWKVTALCLQDLIVGTLLPFLSVAEWADLKTIIVDTGHQADLLRCLAFTAACGGFCLEPALPFDVEIQSNDRKLKDMGVLSAENNSETLYSLLIFKTQMCRLLAGQFEPSLYLASKEVVVHDQDKFSFQYFGIVIDSLHMSKAGAASYVQYETKLNKVRDWYLTKIKSNNSSVARLSRALLSEIEYQESKGLGDATNIVMIIDNQVQVALGLAMADRQNFSLARMLILHRVQEALESENSFHTVECGLLVSEFIKCCNALGKASEGEMIGRRMIERRGLGSQIDLREDTIYIVVALADSLVAMSRYSRAYELLANVGAASTLTDYLEAVIALRLNKVRRRLDCYKELSLGKEGSLLRAINMMHTAGEDVKLECADELLSTICLLRQHQKLDYDEAEHALTLVASHLDNEVSYAATWRSSVLRRNLLSLQQVRTLLAVSPASEPRNISSIDSLTKPSSSWMPFKRELSRARSAKRLTFGDSDQIPQPPEPRLEAQHGKVAHSKEEFTDHGRKEADPFTLAAHGNSIQTGQMRIKPKAHEIAIQAPLVESGNSDAQTPLRPSNEKQSRDSFYQGQKRSIAESVQIVDRAKRMMGQKEGTTKDAPWKDLVLEDSDALKDGDADILSDGSFSNDLDLPIKRRLPFKVRLFETSMARVAPIGYALDFVEATKDAHFCSITGIAVCQRPKIAFSPNDRGSISLTQQTSLDLPQNNAINDRGDSTVHKRIFNHQFSTGHRPVPHVLHPDLEGPNTSAGSPYTITFMEPQHLQEEVVPPSQAPLKIVEYIFSNQVDRDFLQSLIFGKTLLFSTGINQIMVGVQKRHRSGGPQALRVWLSEDSQAKSITVYFKEIQSPHRGLYKEYQIRELHPDLQKSRKSGAPVQLLVFEEASISQSGSRRTPSAISVLNFLSRESAERLTSKTTVCSIFFSTEEGKMQFLELFR